jgi:phasin family protein
VQCTTIVAIGKGLFKAFSPLTPALSDRKLRNTRPRSSDEHRYDAELRQVRHGRGDEGVWSRNAQAIATEVADYSKRSFEESAAAFQKLIGAKSLEKAMEVQTEYLQSSCEELVAESAKIGELYSELAREACKPFAGVLMKMPGAK